MKKHINKMAASFVLLVASPAFGQTLSLEMYLDQVQKGNDQYQSLESRTKTFDLQEDIDANLLYAFGLDASIQHITDKRPTNSVAFQGEKTQLNSASVGIHKKTNFGMDTSLSYNISNTRLVGVDSTLVPQNQFYDNYLKLDVSQSLLRNAFGFESQQREIVIRAAAKAGKLNQAFLQKVILSDATSIYYQLEILRTSLDIQKESLERAQFLSSWNQSRVRKNLVDQADYLQAQAAVKSRELDVQRATENIRVVSNTFNVMRGIDSDQVIEQLDPNAIDGLISQPISYKNTVRLDTQAQKHTLEAQTAQYLVNVEGNKPDLVLAGGASLYGRDPDFAQAFGDSVSTSNPVFSIGLNFSMPLPLSLNEKTKQLKSHQIEADQLSYKQTLLEDDMQHKNLVTQMQELKNQLSTFTALEKAQLSKLEREKKRQKNGQSTTFQVLSFEQEYLATQIQRIAHQINLASNYAQLMLYQP